MRHTRIILATALVLFFAVFVQSQEQSSPKPDTWRGLVIDASTPDDAIKTFGQPKKDRLGGLRTYPLNKRLTIDHNSTGFRKLYYENVEGIDHVELVFKDNKLLIVEIHPDKKIPAANLPTIYDVRFV